MTTAAPEKPKKRGPRCRLFYAVDDSKPMAERICRYCGGGPNAHLEGGK